MTTYRPVILVHEIVSISCGVAHLRWLKVEDDFEWIGCEGCELRHWFGLSVKSG